MRAKTFPVGCRFMPTEEELLLLLRQKATGVKLGTDEVEEKILYGNDADPWNVFGNDDRWQILDDKERKDTKRMAYVFTKLTKMSAKKVSRTAGSGTWDGETKLSIPNKGPKIGTRKMLSYVLNSGSEVRGGWTMHEYSLEGDYLNGIENTDYVLCRIIYDATKYTKVRAAKGETKAAKDDIEVQTPNSPKVSGKKRRKFPQENLRLGKMARNDTESKNNADKITTPEAIAMALPDLVSHEVEDILCSNSGMEGQTYTSLLLDDALPIRIWEGDGYGLVDDNDTVYPTALLNGQSLQIDGGLMYQESSLSHISGHSFAPTREEKFYQDIEQNHMVAAEHLDSRTGLIEAATIENIDNRNLSIQEQSYSFVDGTRPVNGQEGDGSGLILDDDYMVQPTALLNGESLQQDGRSMHQELPSSYIENNSVSPYVEDVSYQGVEQTLDNHKVATEALSQGNCDHQIMACHVEVNASLDSVISSDFLPPLEGGDEELYGPLTVTDEWFKDALQHFDSSF